jgi:hypothetical protein
MSIASLLVVPTDERTRSAFQFEHAMAHRQNMQVMGPLDQWSAIPYFIDPTIWDADPGTNWHLNHQQAHHDFISYLPAYFDQTQTAWKANPGIPTNQHMLDPVMNEPKSRSWWTHQNHTEHATANAAILPLPLYAQFLPPAIFALPWWLQPPRLVATFW